MELENIFKKIDGISEKLYDALDRKLIAFYLFGSVMISEDFHPGISDINTFIVLSDDSNPGDIVSIKEIYKKAKDIPLAIPLILKEKEIRESADVFPIEFLEIIEKNKLIRGKDVMLSIKISKEDIRRQCEGEIRAKIIGLRKMLFGVEDITKNLNILYKSLTSTVILLKQFLRLRDMVIPNTRISIIEELEKLYNKKLAGIKNLYFLREKMEKVNKPNVERLLKSYIEELEFFSEIINDEKNI